MARRRKSNRRRRRGRFGFLYKLLSVLAICAAVVLALTLFFRVNTLEISGGVRYTTEQIQEASGIEIGDNLFLLNKFDVRNRLAEELPYIEDVHINRKLPSTLIIEVTECSQVFAVMQSGSAWLISPSGKIVDRVEPAEAEGIPTVDGCKLLAPSVGTSMALAQEYQTQKDSLLALLSALQDREEMDLVGAIHLGDASVLTMEYMDRFTVQMPYSADYAYLLRTARAVSEKLETNETGVIDLTTEGKAYFRQS
jgi:cell division protein FtsQ